MSPTLRNGKPIEIELKYRVVDAAAGDRYLAADVIAGFRPSSPVRSTQVEDRYIDTAGGAMARAGFAARLRQTAKTTTVAVKSSVRRVGTGNVHRREELEGPADRTAHPRDWPPSDARSLILEQCGDAPLVEVVTIRQLRRKRILELDGTSVELSLDEVDAVSRSRVVGRFVELEVELMSGDEAGLAAIDRELADDPGLAPADTSKLQSALRAVAAAEPKRGRRGGAVLPDIEDDRPRDRDADAPVPPIEEIVEAVLAELDATTTVADEVDEVEAADPDAFGATDARDVETGPATPADAARSEAAAAATAEPSAEPGAERTPDGRRSSNDDRIKASEPVKVRSKAKAAAATTDEGGAKDEDVRPHLVVGKTPGVLADDHVAEAGRKVLRFHLAKMIAKEAGTRDGVDPEDLHGMRVATRRQRAAWRVFGEAFRPERTKKHRGRLREVAARLGAVRDLDVLIEAADAYRADLAVAEQRALEPLLAAWRLHRDDARQLLMRELDSDGYRRWLDDYAEFVRHEGVAARPVVPTEPHRVRDTAASRIHSAYEHVRSYEPVLRWADVDTLHELRIHGKWLRYSLEFVREALGPDADGLIARVTALQDHLGLMKDADVAAHLARSFLVERAGSISDGESAAIARYLVSREKEVARLHRTVGRSWRGVGGIAFRRALGRALASL
ncbi:MAG TPA: CHAD domain-containing protein [Candidatus Limnocylindrales bacterium]|nr:CHAD domain-containing protein [Candidatus Limnocylindrales bacterium]